MLPLFLNALLRCVRDLFRPDSQALLEDMRRQDGLVYFLIVVMVVCLALLEHGSKFGIQQPGVFHQLIGRTYAGSVLYLALGHKVEFAAIFFRQRFYSFQYPAYCGSVLVQRRYLYDDSRDVALQYVPPVAVDDFAKLGIRPRRLKLVDTPVEQLPVLEHAHPGARGADANPKYGHGC